MTIKSEFKRLREDNRSLLHFSPTDMVKCPIQLKGKKELTYEYKYTPYTLKIFEKGNHIHIIEGIKRKNSRDFIDKEYYMRIIHLTNNYIFSGYADFIMWNENGIYIEDLKTCNRSAFYHFNNETGSIAEIIQVSCYRFLYYVVHGVKINHAIITKIDRENTLNRISLEIDMMSIKETERYINFHPTIRIMLGEIDEKTFLKETKKFIKKNRWICKYCDERDDCPVNIALEAEEKKL